MSGVVLGWSWNGLGVVLDWFLFLFVEFCNGFSKNFDDISDVTDRQINAKIHVERNQNEDPPPLNPSTPRPLNLSTFQPSISQPLKPQPLNPSPDRWSAAGCRRRRRRSGRTPLPNEVLYGCFGGRWATSKDIRTLQ